MFEFFDKTGPELLILTIIILLAAIIIFVHWADGALLIGALSESQQAGPDKDMVVRKIKDFRMRRGRYPPELGRVGLRGNYGTVFLEYATVDDRFEICYHYFPYLGAMSSCYDSAVGEWKMQ